MKHPSPKYMLIAMAAGAMLAGGSACSHVAAPTQQEDILVAVGDSALTLRDVLLRIPSGLSEQDSVEMFNSIVERWVRRMMLSDVASENVEEFENINRLAEDYRDNLIIERYLRSKVKEAPGVSDRDIRTYYEEHAEELKLSQPLVKGIYIKVADSEENLADIRRWMAAASPAAVDKIEKSGLRQASQYEYFKDKWIEWNEVADQIPYRFYDADAFLSSTKDFETSYSGSTYLLHIYEYLPSGSPMPFEYASGLITEILGKQGKASYRLNLLSSLYARGVRDGVLKPGLYDPVKRQMRPRAPGDSADNKSAAVKTKK